MAMVSHDTGEFLEVNQALLNYVGYTKEEFLKMSFWDITPEKYNFQEQSQIDELNRTGKFGPNEKEYIRKDGTLIPIRLAGFKLTDVSGKEVVWGIIEDITLEKKLAEEYRKAKHLSVTDSLTGLFNRQKLDNALDDEIKRATRSFSPFCVILLDLDDFKRVNDTYGHLVGDKILIEISEILRHKARETDIVGRWGGEEFMIVCPVTDGLGGKEFAEKIRVQIEQHSFPTIGKNTASVGIVNYEQSDDVKSILERVDKALYQAKTQGKNRVVVL